MKVKLEVKIKPFSTPNFIVINSDKANKQSLPLSAFDSITLEKLCDDFRDEIFKKAGKHRTININIET